MIILYDKLTAYCLANKKQVPNHNQCGEIGRDIMALVKANGKFIPIEKIPYSFTMQVNGYPEEIESLVDMAIEKYFSNNGKKKKVFYCTYIVDNLFNNSFEAALLENNLPIRKNADLNNKAKTQYIIPAHIPTDLIKLGITFQSKLSEIKIKKPERKRIKIKN